MASVIKRKLHDHTDKGHSVTNADEFLTALESAQRQLNGIFAYSASTNIPVQRKKQTIKDISIYTDFLFPVEEHHIQAYRYVSLGEGVQLMQDKWSWLTEHMPTLRIAREVFPIQGNNWPLTTCPVVNKY